VTQYARRRDLASRAKTWQQLYDPVLPGIFLAWAKRTDIDVPAELVEAVQKRGVQIADWKGLYEQAVAGLDNATKVRDSQIADWRRLYDQSHKALQDARDQIIEITEEKNRIIAALQERVAVAADQETSNAALGVMDVEEKPLGTKERESLLKLVIGMARDSYNFDPKLSRSSVPQEIANDLAKHGIFLGHGSEMAEASCGILAGRVIVGHKSRGLFGNEATTIKRLRKGEPNKSDLGGVLQTNDIHIALRP